MIVALLLSGSVLLFYYTFFHGTLGSSIKSQSSIAVASASVPRETLNKENKVKEVTASKVESGKFRRWSWLLVNGKLQYPDPVSGELVSAGSGGRRFRFSPGEYPKFYLWVTDEEVSAYVKRGLPPVTGGEGPTGVPRAGVYKAPSD